MQQNVKQRLATVFETEELKGFSRSITELHWLLVILVLLYFFIPIRPITDSDALIITLICYAAFILVFRYLNPQPQETRWKLALETWAMIIFITTALWHTGLVESPLLNLYLLVIIACAITLGKVMTFLELLLIACCYLFMGYATHAADLFAPATFTALMASFSPFLLVAYVTSMLAADVQHAKLKIMRLSQTDDLTGLLNMRAFNPALEKEIARANRYSLPFSVMMIDVDGLKAINDRYGHATGNRLVQAVARAIGDCVRKSDLLARYGGDEFVILMTHTGNREALSAAERIRSTINNTTLTVKGRHISVSASIGIASFPDTVRNAGEVLGKADVALYQSKRGGRDKVSRYQKEAGVVTACS